MKVIYEPGDILEVQDIYEAGPTAAEWVELVVQSKKTSGLWKVRIVDMPREELYIVHKKYFNKNSL